VKKKVIVLLVVMAISVFGQMPNADSTTLLRKVSGLTADSVRKDTTVNPDQVKKLPIIKRSINYSIAAKFAIGTMLFIAFLLTAGDAWNPGD